jgi:hypothetical protein
MPTTVEVAKKIARFAAKMLAYERAFPRQRR